MRIFVVDLDRLDELIKRPNFKKNIEKRKRRIHILSTVGNSPAFAGVETVYFA